MKNTTWKDIAELVGIAAIVGSLIFVGLQMKQAENIANADRRQSRVADFIELTNSINEHAETWIRGNSGADLNEVEGVIYANLVNAMDEYYFLSASVADSLGNERAAQGIRSDFVGILSKNPGAVRVWNARQNARIERLEAFEADAPTGRPYWIDSIRSELQVLN